MKKTRLVYLLDLLEERGDGGQVGQCDLVCVERLWMIGLMVVMLMSYSRVMSMVFILWGVGLVLRNESEIE